MAALLRPNNGAVRLPNADCAHRRSRPRTASCRSAPSTRDCDAGLFNRQIADRLMSRCTRWRDISNSNEARALIRTALNGSGDIIPERDTMHTRLDPLSAPHRRHRPTLPNPRHQQPGLPRHHAHPGVTAPNPIEPHTSLPSYVRSPKHGLVKGHSGYIRHRYYVTATVGACQ